MSAIEVQPPIVEVRCDREGCLAAFRSDSGFSSRFDRGVRLDARKAGWDVPPPEGKGSRRGTDFCPDHADGGES